MLDGPITVYVDGSCPVCSREARFWQRRATPALLRVVDISRRDFDARTACGLTQLALMRRIHARLPDGALVTGLEVFRRVYARLGFGKCVAISRLPVLSKLLAVCYEVFAFVRFRRALCCAVSPAIGGLREAPEKA